MNKPSALGVEDLRVQIQRIVRYGVLWESKHSAVDRAYRGITQDDMVALLEGAWTLAGEPNWDEAHGNWEYRIAGRDLEGDDLVLKIAVDVELQRIDVITKY